MTVKELQIASGMTQQGFADYFRIPLRTAEGWIRGNRKCADYIVELMQYKLNQEGILKERH